MQLLCVVCTFKATCQLFTALSYEHPQWGQFVFTAISTFDTLAKTEIIYPKNLETKVEMDFT